MSLKVLHVGAALKKCRAGDSTSSSSSSDSTEKKELAEIERQLSIREELEMRAAADELKQVLRRKSDGEYHFCYRMGKFINANISAEQCNCEQETKDKDKRNNTLRRQLSLKRLNSQSPSIVNDDDEVEARRPDSPLGRHVSTREDIDKEQQQQHTCKRKHKSRKSKIKE